MKDRVCSYPPRPLTAPRLNAMATRKRVRAGRRPLHCDDPESMPRTSEHLPRRFERATPLPRRAPKMRSPSTHVRFTRGGSAGRRRRRTSIRPLSISPSRHTCATATPATTTSSARAPSARTRVPAYVATSIRSSPSGGGRHEHRAERSLPLRQRPEVQEMPSGRARAPAASAAHDVTSPLHELDNRLVEEMTSFASKRFPEEFLEEVEVLATHPEMSPQFAAPWLVYVAEIQGRPVADWYVEERGWSLFRDGEITSPARRGRRRSLVCGGLTVRR